MKNYFNFIVIVSLFFSCGHKDPNKQIDEGRVNTTGYESSEIGWSVRIPDGWEVIAKDNLEENEQKGKTALEKTAGGEIDVSGLKHLISFKKNQFNLFFSTSEPFKEEYPGEYLENSKKVRKLLFDTYRAKGIKADSSSGTVTIDGLQFQTFEFKLYGQDGKVILSQIMYSRLINGLDFGVNINFNSNKYRDVMLKALMDSKFKKK
jgi:hypothetical protein